MNNFYFAEPNEILGRRLDTVVNAPTVSPSPFPFTQEDRDFSEIFSYSISLGNRLIIGAIILMRLRRYHKSGVLRWSELKTKFHVLLLFTVRFTVFNLYFLNNRYSLVAHEFFFHVGPDVHALLRFLHRSLQSLAVLCRHFKVTIHKTSIQFVRMHS